jgi:DNA invertase Pin-like site-specific DNA recombinase
MKAGYVRLSRDDDKRNYVSIENQKLIINQYAAEQNMVIDRWYEDDGVSGYIFDRPGFNQLMSDLDRDIDTVFVKDFSRLGRHNAKVLLLLDDFQERGKHLIVIDDNYDSEHPDDDTIGIKTWYNERYVKDTSKKIKRAIGARQKEGTLMTRPPFGYQRNERDKSMLEIVPKEADYVKQVYDLYLQGLGYRKIANHLTKQGVSTPSMVRRERELEEGHVTKRQVAAEWTDSMVKDMLDNDFYIGTLRLRKRSRAIVHGKDRRVPKEEQCIFENNHPAIIDKATFDLIQDMKEKRIRNNYRGNHRQGAKSNPFCNRLFCKDCGSRLTPIRRQSKNGERKYYICSTYNTKGKRYCKKSHLIEEPDLINNVIAYVKLCRNVLCDVIAAYDIQNFKSKGKSRKEEYTKLQSALNERKRQLKILFSQKVLDLSKAAGNAELITESYDALQNEILSQIQSLQAQLKELDDIHPETSSSNEKPKNALDIINKIIENGILDQKDIEILIERIEIDANGLPEITLTYHLSNLIFQSPALELNHMEHKRIHQILKLIKDDNRDFTSAKYLSENLTNSGYKISKTQLLPYINLMLDMGIIEKNENPRKPYTIIKSANEIQSIMDFYAQNLH